ncbi:MAG: hypothetical protein FJ087_20625, partial [Deltaproteobacteria bacterium]|nr:hypothetical protein [Deltaproteobacteria bacterium]
GAVRTWLLLLAAATTLAALASCGGGGSAPTPQLDVPEAGPDASEPGKELPDAEDDAEVGEPGPDGADAPETEVEPPPKAPELSLWLVTATGPKGEQDPEISIATADEPPAYAQSKGLQVDVVVRTANLENGREVSLQVGSVVVGSQKVVVDAEGVGTATFQAVTFVHSQAGYDVKAWSVNQAKLYGDVTKKVHVDTGGCAVSVLPSNAACLLADADPDTDGVQVVFTVTDPERTCDTAQVDFDAGGGATGSSGPVPLDASGSAKITMTVLANAAGVDGAKAAVTASVTDSSNPDRASSLPPIDYTIDLTDPVIDLVAPDKPLLTLADDKDGDPSNGLTLDVAGTATGIAAGSSLSLALNQQPAGETTPDGEGAWLFADLALTADGSYEAVVSGQDACGRTGADSVTFQARVTKATYVILHPSPGGTLLAKDDADPTASPETDHAYQTDFLVSGGAIEAGTTLTVRCRKDALGSHWVDVGATDVTGPSADGNYAVPVVLDVHVLGNAASCQVLDDAPNPATSSEVAFKVALPAPAIHVLAPAAGASVAEAKLAVGTWAANLDGVEPSVEVRDAGGINVVPDAKPGKFQAGALAFDLMLESGGTPIPDGAYTLVVDATDALGNRASETAGSVTSVAFTLDTTAPTVAITAPDHDTIDPANNPADADADPAKPGHQVVLAVDVSTGGGDGTEVCEQRVGGVLRCATLAGGATTATFTITVLPGANVVNAWATDPAGNRGDAPARTLTLAVSGPRVTIVQPAGDGPVTTLPLDVVVEVTDKDLAPVSGAEVTLEVAGADGATGTTGADGRVTLQIASLAATPTEVLARAQVAGETSWSDPLSLWLKTGTPFIGFLKPLAGDVVNLAYAGCAAGANCLIEVVLEALNCEDDSTGSLTIDCGPGKIQALQAKVKAGTLRFPGSVLHDQSTCSLVASVTDLAGQAAAAGPIQVTVDRVAPVVTITRPAPELTGLGYLLDEDPATDGMQYTVSATVAGSAAGRACKLTVTGGGAPLSAEVQVPAGANPECVFAAVSLPNGSLILEVRADDAAGNATVARRSIEVLWGQPQIRLVVPSYVDGTACAAKAQCPASAVCGGGTCATPWGATTVRSLRLTAEHVANESGNVRICSNLPGLAGPDCQTAGFKQVAAGTVLPNQALHEVSVAGLPDGLHVLIAEARTLAGAAWVSTFDSPNAIERLRNIYQDTVVPSVQAVTSPSDTLPPVGTLNAAEQVSPGVFTIRATASEPSDVTFYVDGGAKATVATVDGAASADIALVGPAPRDAVSFQVWAVAKDAVGNLSAQPGPIFAPTVDTMPPTLA